MVTSFLSAFYIFGDQPSVRCGVGEDLFPVYGLLFGLVYCILCLTKLLSLRRSHLLIVDLNVCATGVMFRKQSPILIFSRVPHTFSFKRFSVAGFMLRSLIHLNLSFVHGYEHGSICSLLHTLIQSCQHHLLKMIFSLPPPLNSFLSKIRCL